MLSTAHRGRPLLLVFSEGPSLDVSECVCAEENIDEIQYVEGALSSRGPGFVGRPSWPWGVRPASRVRV